MILRLTYFWLLFLGLCSPILSFLYYAFLEDWQFSLHLSQYLSNSLILITMVGTISTILGVSSALLVTFFTFPGCHLVQMLLFLPLALPGYITAWTYSYNFSFSGPVRVFLRESLNFNYFPDINNIPGCALVMSLSLYPYVYMFVRAHLASIAPIMNVARTFGYKPLYNIAIIALPIAKHSIISGVILVLMESIADFGTPNFFAVETLSTGIYRKWALTHNYAAASQLTLMLLAIIACAIIFESCIRKDTLKMVGPLEGKLAKWDLKGIKKILATVFTFSLPAIAILPTLIPLLWWSSTKYFAGIDLITPTFNTIFLAAATAIITVMIALLLIYLKGNSSIIQCLLRVLTLGYSIPNSVIAIGIMICAVSTADWINHILSLMRIDYEVILIGSLPLLIYSYAFRFIAIPINAIESGLTKIPKEIHWSAIIIGGKNFHTFSAIEMRMITKSVIVSMILVFTDTLKELSATLIIRPFNFETIAIKIFELVSEERYREAALPALIIFIVDLAALLLLIKIHFAQENLQTASNHVNNSMVRRGDGARQLTT